MNADRSPLQDEGTSSEVDSDLGSEPEDRHWENDLPHRDDIDMDMKVDTDGGSEQLTESDDGSNGYFRQKIAIQRELPAASKPSSDLSGIGLTGTACVQRVRAKAEQKLLTLMDRGIIRTSRTSARNIPLGYLNGLIESTNGSRSYIGYAIHQEPRQSNPKAKRSYSLLDPVTERKRRMVLRALLSREKTKQLRLTGIRADVNSSITAGSRGPLHPLPLTRISQRTGVPVLFRAEKYQRHVRKLAALYLTLDAQGVRCTKEIVSLTRTVRLNWLREVLGRTAPKSADGEATEQRLSGSGLIIHNIAPEGEPVQPILLDWREQIGTERGGESVSLISAWIEKHR